MASFSNKTPASELIRETDDIIYYNISIPHNPSDGENPTIARFKEDRTDALISKMENYYMACLSFEIPGTELPLTVAEIQTGSTQTDPNLTVYQVCLTYSNGNNYPAYVEFITIDQQIEVPPAPAYNPPSYAQPDSIYYYIYAYEDFVHMVNVALQSATSALETGEGITLEAPYINYNPLTQLFSLIVPYDYSSIPVTIYMNEKLLRFFEGFSVNFWGYNQPDGKDYSFIIRQYEGNSNAYAPPGATGMSGCNCVTNPPPYLRFIQQYNTIQYWNSFRDIVFETNIKIVPEWIPSISSQFNSLSGNGNASFRKTLTSFLPTLENPGDSRSQLVFNATGPWRIINFAGHGQLKAFDLQIYWLNNYGYARPIYIAYGQIASVKFVFIKKSLYKASLK